ncbi:MAG: protein kinase domain-containing protein [Pseudonocardiaceae bacterium]
MNSGTVVFDRYELHEQIGAGGTSVVWRATDQLLHQIVALKRISFAALGGGQAQLIRDRALREARLAAQLRSHPNVVAVYDVLVDQGDIWLVMEYLPARSLRDILNTDGPLDPAEVAQIGADLADALAAAHARGIEHRDVKPGNVLIGADGVTKLTDFGISHLAGDTHLTITGITGTPAYFAPEVVVTGESSSASDVFSLGATLYAAVEGQPPFGTDDNTFRLLNIVRTGIIRPLTRAGHLEPLLLRLLQLNPAIRPDAATTRDLLTRLSAPASGSRASQPASRTLRHWWPPRRRTTITAGALFTVAALIVSVVIGTSLLTDPSDEMQPPATAVLLTNPSDPREADPCALINLESLRPLGQPRFNPPSPFLESCEVAITATGKAKTYLQVIFYSPSESPSELGKSREISGVPVVRRDRVGVAGTTGCQDWLAPTGQLWATITAFPYRDGSEDLCAVTETATVAAVETLVRNGGVPGKPNRNAGYALALADACATLNSSALSKVPGLNPNKKSPGFANWSCSWGTEGNGTQIELHFGLRDSFDGLGDLSTPIAEKTTYRASEPGSCDVYVVHRPPPTGSGAAEIFLLNVTTTVLPEIEACNQAAALATVIEEQLRRNPRDADPCALINLDSLQSFGEPDFATPPWLNSCRADIETTDDHNIELRVIISDYEPPSELKEKEEPQRIGDWTVVPSGMVDYWGTKNACRTYIVLTPDQPKIIVYALTYDDNEASNVCPVAEVATTAVIEALNQNGGITYTPDRTTSYSHAGSDACALLDDSALTAVPGLDPDPYPDYANWICRWGMEGEEDGLSVNFRLEKTVDSSFFKELQTITIAGKQAFLDRKKDDRCDIHVVHRFNVGAIEILELQLEAPLAIDEVCSLVTNLATAAEKHLPDA